MTNKAGIKAGSPKLPGQVVLVMQGGGANASSVPWSAFGLGNLMHNLGAVSSGIPGFFTPNLQALFGPHTPIGVAAAAFYGTTPLRDSVIFAAQLWQQENALPNTIAQVSSRLKDIQYSSRAQSHTARQQQISHLRHVVRELGRLLPERARVRPETRELLSWGCGAVMHVLPLQAPALEGEDHTKDIDFTPGGIRARWQAGREFAQRKIAAAPWSKKIDPVAGILVHA